MLPSGADEYLTELLIAALLDSVALRPSYPALTRVAEHFKGGKFESEVMSF